MKNIIFFIVMFYFFSEELGQCMKLEPWQPHRQSSRKHGFCQCLMARESSLGLVRGVWDSGSFLEAESPRTRDLLC